MNGNFPADDEYLKWRDRDLDTEARFDELYEADLKCIDRYQKFLVKFDAENAFDTPVVPREQLQLTSVSSFEFDNALHEPSPAALLAAAAVLEHAHIVAPQQLDL